MIRETLTCARSRALPPSLPLPPPPSLPLYPSLPPSLFLSSFLLTLKRRMRAGVHTVTFEPLLRHVLECVWPHSFEEVHEREKEPCRPVPDVLKIGRKGTVPATSPGGGRLLFINQRWQPCTPHQQCCSLKSRGLSSQALHGLLHCISDLSNACKVVVGGFRMCFYMRSAMECSNAREAETTLVRGSVLVK